MNLRNQIVEVWVSYPIDDIQKLTYRNPPKSVFPPVNIRTHIGRNFNFAIPNTNLIEAFVFLSDLETKNLPSIDCQLKGG